MAEGASTLRAGCLIHKAIGPRLSGRPPPFSRRPDDAMLGLHLLPSDAPRPLSVVGNGRCGLHPANLIAWLKTFKTESADRHSRAEWPIGHNSQCLSVYDAAL